MYKTMVTGNNQKYLFSLQSLHFIKLVQKYRCNKGLHLLYSPFKMQTIFYPATPPGIAVIMCIIYCSFFFTKCYSLLALNMGAV